MSREAVDVMLGLELGHIGINCADEAEAAKTAETIANLPLSLSVKAEEGKLFGTVTATDLAEALAAKGITVDRKQISVEAVKTVGEFEATVRLHKEVKATIKFSVSAAE